MQHNLPIEVRNHSMAQEDLNLTQICAEHTVDSLTEELNSEEPAGRYHAAANLTRSNRRTSGAGCSAVTLL